MSEPVRRIVRDKKQVSAPLLTDGSVRHHPSEREVLIERGREEKEERETHESEAASRAVEGAAHPSPVRLNDHLSGIGKPMVRVDRGLL